MTKIINNKKTTTPFYQNDENIFEIGIDEAGRGPLFGRVYTGAVVLPKENFDYSRMKDSKKFASEKKILETETYIKENALFWSVSSNNEQRIDTINILQATMESMHFCVDSILKQMNKKNYNVHCKDNDESKCLLLVDGNYFNEYTYIDNEMLNVLPHVTVKGGDDLYSSIAAASILAKCARDRYIKEICSDYPKLDEYYGIMSNKGYAARRHINGINEYGITPFHRKTYSTCNGVPVLNINSLK